MADATCTVTSTTVVGTTPMATAWSCVDATTTTTVPSTTTTVVADGPVTAGQFATYSDAAVLGFALLVFLLAAALVGSWRS